MFKKNKKDIKKDIEEKSLEKDTENNLEKNNFKNIKVILLTIFSLFLIFAFITKNKNMTKESSWKTTESGLKYKILKLGTGEKPDSNDKVEVHYHGTLKDGTVFDSSVERGEKITFGLNQVIAGWTEGLQLMPVGSKFKFDIPAKLAYGENSDICVPKSFLKTAQGQSIPKEAFTGKKCTAQTKDGEEDGEFLVNPRAHPMSGKDLIFEVELFAIK